MVIAVVDVIGSKSVGWSVPSSVAFISELNVLLVFMSIAYVTRERGHIRITILEKFMSPGVNFAVMLFLYVLAIITCGLCSWRAVALIQTAIETNAIRSGAIDFPTWPSNVAVLIGFALMTIVYILLFARAIINKTNPKAEAL